MGNVPVAQLLNVCNASTVSTSQNTVVVEHLEKAALRYIRSLLAIVYFLKIFMLYIFQVKQPELQSAMCITETGTSSDIPCAVQSTAEQQRINDVSLPTIEVPMLS